MFETLLPLKSAVVVAEALDSLAGEDKPQVTKNQILSGGLADWAIRLKQLFPKEADKLLGYMRDFYSVKAQAETPPKFDSIESYLQYRHANCAAE
jgi:hypothetical protein